MSEPLAEAFKALLVLPQTTKLYDGTVDANPTYPYVLLRADFRMVHDRSMTRAGQSYRLPARTTISALTSSAVRAAATPVVDSLEGARLVVPGWSCGTVESVPNEQHILEDFDVTDTATGKHPLYLVLDWVFVASRN